MQSLTLITSLEIHKSWGEKRFILYNHRYTHRQDRSHPECSDTPQGLLPTHNESSRRRKVRALSSLVSTNIRMATKVARGPQQVKVKGKKPLLENPGPARAIVQEEKRMGKSRRDTLSKESFRMISDAWVGRKWGLRGPIIFGCNNKARHYLPQHVWQDLGRLDSLGFHKV